MEEDIVGWLYERLVEPDVIKPDRYLVWRWCNLEQGTQITDADRQKAYETFYKKTGNANIANRQTIRKWFGLGGIAMPKRWQVINIGFALGLDVAEVNDYLIHAALQPILQVNDYEECIVMYALDNHMSMEHAEEMISFFEMHVDFRLDPMQTSRTELLLKEYSEVRDMDEASFLKWMHSNKNIFKGYSLTVLRCFKNILHEAMGIFRDNTSKCLRDELEELGYFKAGYPFEANPMRQYIKNLLRGKSTRITKEKANEIRYYINIVFANRDRINDVLREIYLFGDKLSSMNKHQIYDRMKGEIPSISAKYISEVLNTANIKKNLIEDKLMLSKERLEKTDSKTMQAPNGRILTDEDKELHKKEQRIHNIRRADILIPLQYVVINHYMNGMEEGETVDKEKLKGAFIKKANEVLSLCNMGEINTHYGLDICILATFEINDPFIFSELLE